MKGTHGVITVAVALALAGPPAAAGPGQEEAVRKELAKLQGTWQLVSAETDGKKMPEEQARKVRVVIQGGRHFVYFGDKVIAKGVRFRIDPSTSPKSVEDTLEDGRVLRGIYELDGDTLRSCVAAPGKERPARFSGAAGSGTTLRVFRRVRAEGQAAEGADKDEYARFRGTWKIVALEVDGKKVPEDFFKNSRLVIEGDRFTYHEGEVPSHGTFKVDAGKKPKHIDIHFTDGPEKGKTIRGIYELEGDTYRVCLPVGGGERPTAFASRPGSGLAVEVLRRVKAAAP